MNANRDFGAAHPHAVYIPDSKAAGIRSYAEPAEPHPLQLLFLHEAGERAWIDAIGKLLSSGRTAEADARLGAELAGFDGTLARLCRGTPQAQVGIDGWEDLLPILAEWEGPRVSAITLGLTNPPDLVFAPGDAPEPELLLGLYSDEAFAFTASTPGDILAECTREMPAWVGREEDVEFYCQVTGLAELNAALIHCKHRYFLRDGRDGVEGRAPGGYVEYVLGCWLRATRFVGAVERAVAEHGLPDGVRLIAGTVAVNADLVTLVDPARTVAIDRDAAPAPVAALTMKPWIPREDAATDPQTGSTLRQRLAASGSETPQPPASPPPQDEPPTRLTAETASVKVPSGGFLARLFARLRR